KLPDSWSKLRNLSDYADGFNTKKVSRYSCISPRFNESSIAFVYCARVFLFNLAMLITPFYFFFKDLHYTLLEIVSRAKYFNIIAQTINSIRCTFSSGSKIFSSYYLSYIV